MMGVRVGGMVIILSCRCEFIRTFLAKVLSRRQLQTTLAIALRRLRVAGALGHFRQ